MNKYTIVNRRDIEPGVYWFRLNQTDKFWDLAKIYPDKSILLLGGPDAWTLHNLVEFYPGFEFVGPLEPPA
jgi:hypothetical protein